MNLLKPAPDGARMMVLLLAGALFLIYPYNAFKYLEEQGVFITTNQSEKDAYYYDAYVEKKIERGRDPDSFDYGSYMDSGLGYPAPVNALFNAIAGVAIIVMWWYVIAGVPWMALACWIFRDGGDPSST